MHRITLDSETDIAGWREKARALLLAEVPPAEVEWSAGEAGLFGGASDPFPDPKRDAVTISKELLKDIQTALLHSDPERFTLAYRIVHRAQSEPALHRNPADEDMHRLGMMARSVRRDIHKMHAFVRFRKTGESDEGRERFIAWFEPEHHIAEAVAGFFRNRFTGMDWLIVTPEASIAWDGEKVMTGPGGAKSDVPQEDAVEDEWRAYYASIFNPARVKTKAMQAEMPQKYWRNLPEAALIPTLQKEAGARVRTMVDAQDENAIDVKPVEAPAIGSEAGSLEQLYDALRAADDYPSENFSEKLVLGEGPADAALMFVGEQPGDVEDQQGRPFVGPAGQVLDRGLEKAGIEREQSYVTNAVKRFKFTPRGPRRIHQKPTNDDIEYYRWWLEQERRIIDPSVVIALGATAARGLTGKQVTISRNRGVLHDFRGNSRLLITVHPSYLLRLPDENAKKLEFEKFVRDLSLACEAVAA